MMPISDMRKTSKQADAVRLIVKNTYTLLEGGSRSGKTFIALYVMFVRAVLHPGSKHLVARFRFNHAKQSIGYDTGPKVSEAMKVPAKLNRTDWFFELSNGSTIWIGGLDGKERTEKILGNEYDTIFL